VLRAASVFGRCAGTAASWSARRRDGLAVVGEWLAGWSSRRSWWSTRRPGSPVSASTRSATPCSARAPTPLTGTISARHRLARPGSGSSSRRDPMQWCSPAPGRRRRSRRAAGHYLRAAEQALHILDLDATAAQDRLGIGCEPPEDLSFALLGLPLRGLGRGPAPDGMTMADAEELMRLDARAARSCGPGPGRAHRGHRAGRRIPELLAATRSSARSSPRPRRSSRIGARVPGRDLHRSTCSAGSQRAPRSSRGSPRRRGPARPSRSPGSGGTSRSGSRVVCVETRAGAQPLRGDPADLRRDRPATGCTSTCSCSAASTSGTSAPRAGAAPARSRRGRRHSLGVASSLRGSAWLAARDRGALEPARALAAQLAEYGIAHRPPLEEYPAAGCSPRCCADQRFGSRRPRSRGRTGGDDDSAGARVSGLLATLSALRLAQGELVTPLAAAETAVEPALRWAAAQCSAARSPARHAEALDATGAHDAARRAIGRRPGPAVRIADRIADPAYRTSFLGDVPENALTLALARSWLGDAAPTPRPPRCRWNRDLGPGFVRHPHRR